MASEDEEQTPARLFEGARDGLTLYEAVADVVADLGEAEVRVTKSQIAFRRRTGFAYVWRLGKYVKSEIRAWLSQACANAG